MQIASILSDLTSLRVCDQTAAQNLVSARRSAPASSVEAVKQRTAQLEKDGDPDLQRAKDLVDLHWNIKVKHEEQGLDNELEDLRRKVDDLVQGLERSRR